MNSVFSEQILADKLSKLNSTQQCIETLSHWCIFHRGKAEQVVATWEKQFRGAEMAKKVPLLYLANDILQNSKRKGNEFVTEFWKVLPGSLKEVLEKGDEHGKNVVSRLVTIWEERKVFGSRAQSLKDVMLGEDAPPPLELNKKRSRSVKITKRDSRSIRTKLTVGGAAEKIVSAFHLVVSELPNEDTEMNNCMSAIDRVRKMEKDVEIACSSGKGPRRETLAKELEGEENILKQCIEKLKSAEASRAALVSQLKEALNEQESELENIRTQIQVAQAQAEEANIMQKRLNDENYIPKASSAAVLVIDASAKTGQKSQKTAADIAAEVADKLTASTSSQMIMHSVLSSFAAEEAKNAGLTKSSTSSTSYSSVPVNPAQSLPPAPPTHSYQSVMLPQPIANNPSTQSQYHLLPNPPSQQYIQPSGGIMAPYAYSSMSSVPPGPPQPPPYMVSPMVSLTPQPSQMTQQQPMPLAAPPTSITQQQPLGPPGFRPPQPPGMVYYTHPPHS